jgi:hypothetical protein
MNLSSIRTFNIKKVKKGQDVCPQNSTDYVSD